MGETLRRWAGLLLAAGLSCITATGAQAERARTPPRPEPGPDQAVVYIYRTASFAFAARGSAFLVDDVKIVVLGYHGCTVFAAPAGNHVIKQRWPLDISFGSAAAAPVRWEPGRTYYYRLDTGLEVNAMFWRVDEVSSGMGIEDTADCRYSKAFNLDKLRPSLALPTVAASPEGKGQLVFYRPKLDAGGAIGVRVHEDGQEVCALGNGRYCVVVVEPGRHVFSTHADGKEPFELEVSAGETLYVQGVLAPGTILAKFNLRRSSRTDFESVAVMLKPGARAEDQTEARAEP